MPTEIMPATINSQDLSIETRANILTPYLGKTKWMKLFSTNPHPINVRIIGKPCHTLWKETMRTPRGK